MGSLDKPGQSELPPLEELVNRNYISVAQLATLQGVTYRTARSWCVSGRVKATQVGGQWRIYEDDLREFLAEGNQTPARVGGGVRKD